MTPINIEYNGYLITTDKALLQPEAIHRWLSEESYWSKHIPFSVVKTAFDHSYCIGVLKDGVQVGYARFVTDYATFAYLADVYVEEAHRGQGLSKKMMEVLMELGWVKGLRRIMLATLDAHGLYEQFGFTAPAIPERCMEITRPVIYGDKESALR
ncbi:MAG: GNAT family N-acetyltransferase [Sphingobacteriales bacterium]|nr:MAG: GNAT family N-acetyltransferase [Sphingobacteriales bacterium]